MEAGTKNGIMDVLGFVVLCYMLLSGKSGLPGG